MIDLKDIKTEVKSFEFENGYTIHSVTSKYGVHTLYDQVPTLDDVDDMIESHIAYIVSVYAGIDCIYDTKTKTIIKRQAEELEQADEKKSKKKSKKLNDTIDDMDDTADIVEETKHIENSLDDEDDYGEKVEELGQENRGFIPNSEEIGEDTYDSMDDFYENDN